MSSPASTPKLTPKRSTPRRAPLQERTPSQKNEAAGRLQKDGRQELVDVHIFTSTPFPTKPQHVLLPSTVRKQRSRQNVENEFGAFFNSSLPDMPSSASTGQNRYGDQRTRRAPNLQLKKSVTALRDMYEAQAESSRPSTAQHSRPSTAAPSPALRPTTASSRIRSTSSSDGFSGHGAWEMLGLPKVSADDLALLPTLSESNALSQLESERSFASRVRNQPTTSSPNFRTFGSSSSGLPAFHDVVTSSDPIEGSSSSELDMTGMSSPNLIQLRHSSSEITTDPTPPLQEEEEEDEGESSPILEKLGTTSPQRSSSPAPSVASVVSRKRKRSEMEGSAYAGRTPLFFGARHERRHSSPPVHNILVGSDLSVQSSGAQGLSSSPPEVGSVGSEDQGASSPIIRVHGRFGGDRSSIVSAHTNLQSVLSSSPGPPIHRPIIRAPDINQFETLALQKRTTSGQTEGSNPVKLSPVPSVTNIEIQHLSSTDLSQFQPRRSSSRISMFTEELDKNLDDESIAPAQAYIIQNDLNNSQANMISDTDRNEASDELRALPGQQSSFAAALSQARSASFLNSATSSSNSLSRFESMRSSMDSRLQSMRSFAHARNDSFRSSLRPGSSSSYVSQNIVPTWARRYYSGFYRNSFHYLYQSSTNLSSGATQIHPASQPVSRPTSLPVSSSHDTVSTRSRSDLRRSLSRSLKNFIPSILMSPTRPARPELDVRQSHTTVGIGPLVSNPVRPQSELLSRPPSPYQSPQSIRRVSAPLSAADPRYHWNGIIEEPESAEEAEAMQDHEYTGEPRYADAAQMQLPVYPNSHGHHHASFRFLRLPTPHLHHDRRLHTGSSSSQGFGAPYNARSRWQPPGGLTDEVTDSRTFWFNPDLRDAQIFCFVGGFLCPLVWFLGALLPLPPRPCKYTDVEKSAHNSRQFADLPNRLDEEDVIARLRIEKHLRGLEEVRWQNARWWKRMNKCMCLVGIVVLIVIITLAITGTKGHWS